MKKTESETSQLSEEVDTFKLRRNDFKYFASTCEYVRDHNTSTVGLFNFRPGQNVVHDIAEKRRSEKGYLRILLDKNRRFGGSIYIAGRGYHRTSFRFNQNAFIIGHEIESTATLYRMVQLMQEKNPLKPSIKTSNTNELIFDNGNGTGLKSEYKLATAKNMDAGRSQGIHFLHCSEEAMFPSHADELLQNLFMCVPKPPVDTEIWRESTGKGYGNTFQVDVFDAWQEGKYPYFKAPLCEYAPHMKGSDIEFEFAYHNPGSEWVVIIIPWIIDPTCQRQFESKDMKEAFLKRIDAAVSKTEDINFLSLKLQSKYKLTIEQLYWREWSIKNDFKGRIDMFNQENPITIPDSFRTKGSNLYPKDFCDIVEKGCLAPIMIGDIFYRYGFPKIEPHPTGHISVWERYDTGELYFLTVDAAGGKKDFTDKVVNKKEPDKTVIDVWNHRTGRQAAQWHGDIDYDLISDVVIAIGIAYGHATACVELNNHGYKVVGDLKDKEYPMYYHKPGEAGWSTNKKTKADMKDSLLDGCREGLITVRCKQTVAEMRTFVEKSGKFGAEAGCKDDRVITAQLACQMMKLLPKRSALQDEKKKGPSGYQYSQSSWMAA